jgi:shikimate kinase
MTRRNIILTGFMGTGKSSTGRLLARKLGYEFIDTDQLIESLAHCSVADTFAGRGEAAFRAMEAEVARELAGRRGLVIATGGRMMLNPDNAAALGAEGRIYCLTAEPEEIIRRLSSPVARNRRPLLADRDLEEYVHNLLAERAPAYARFTQIDTTGKKPYQVAAMLYKKIRNETPTQRQN